MLCPGGRYQNLIASADCEECMPGTYAQADEVSFECKKCERGRYVGEAGRESCESCAVGTYQNSESASTCLACAAGTVAPLVGSEDCAECSSSVDFQPEAGQAACVPCPAHSIAVNGHTDCHCGVYYYAIPYTDLVVFQDVDPAGYNTYYSLYIDGAEDSSVFDPNELVGFYCALCPEGADCGTDGTTLANVTASEGYFIGINSAGTSFLTCLNDHCLDQGACSDGYTGISCASCESGNPPEWPP